jgi:hypothetical protein
MWIESREGVKEAILGVVSDGAELSTQEKTHLLNRSTKDFSGEIRRKIKELGVVKSTKDNFGSYGKISDSIEKGIKIADLIKAVQSSY